MGLRSGNFHVINSLPEGRYQWRVKSVDHGLSTSDWSDWDYFYIDQTPPTVYEVKVNYGVGGQIIVIVNFKEEFEMDNSSIAEPVIYAMHPDMNDIDGDNYNDTLLVQQQSYSANVWTGLLSLPTEYVGRAIKLNISDAKDMRGNIMESETFFKTPEKIISQSGGSVISSDGKVSILFPQNAINEDISVSMTINSTASILLAFYFATAKIRGYNFDALRGTLQNDILKEYIARGTFIFPVEHSLRLTSNVFEFCQQNLSKWNSISISGYHIREAGSTAVQELAFTFANAITYLEKAEEDNLDLIKLTEQVSFFFNAHRDFFEEVAKFRAARIIWAKIIKKRFKIDNVKSQLCRFHVQTG